MIYIINGSFGVGVVVVGIGILLNNEMDDFAVVFEVLNLYGLVGDEVNVIVLRKIFLFSMIFIIVIDNGWLIMVIGFFGGSMIIIIVL